MIPNFPLLNKLKPIWLLLLISPSVFGGSGIFQDPGHIYVGGTLGASVVEVNKTHQRFVYYNNRLFDLYRLEAKQSTRGFIGLNAGYEFSGDQLFPSISIGAGIYNTPFNYQYQGHLIEHTAGGSNATLNEFKYRVSSTRLMAEGQFTWIVNHIAPFVSVGLGSAWNRLRRYTETPVNNTYYNVYPSFHSVRETNFAYQVGIGVGYRFRLPCQSAAEEEQVSLGYRYVGLGDASFGTRGNLYPFKLNLGQLNANEVYFNYTYLF